MVTFKSKHHDPITKVFINDVETSYVIRHNWYLGIYEVLSFCDENKKYFRVLEVFPCFTDAKIFLTYWLGGEYEEKIS